MQTQQSLSAYVSEVVDISFEDAAAGALLLGGQTISALTFDLEIGERIASKVSNAVWFSAKLKSGSLIVPTFKADLIVSPWSSRRTEIGMRPLSRLGHPDSWRAKRFYEAARAVAPALTERLMAAAEQDTIVSQLDLAA